MFPECGEYPLDKFLLIGHCLIVLWVICLEAIGKYLALFVLV